MLRTRPRVATLWPAATLGLALAVCAAPAAAGKIPDAKTTSASVALAPGAVQAATAQCPKKMHVSGGGFAVSPLFSQNGTSARSDDTGTQSSDLISTFTGRRAWTATGAAFTTPPVVGTFQAIARCEKNSLGRLTSIESGSTAIAPGTSSTVGVTCPVSSHVASGGYSAGPTGNLTDPTAFRLLVVESRRSDRRRWEFVAVNPAGAASAGTLSVAALCESDLARPAVEISRSSVIADNARTAATAACSGKKHVVAGGFLISPFVGPAASIDQSLPLAKKTWLVGLYEAPGFSLPAGSTLTTYAYCKKDTPRR